MAKRFTIFITSLTLVFNFSLAPALAVAQNEGGPPEGIQQGPSAEEINQFQQEMGAPPTAFDHAAPPPVDTEEIKNIPEDVKQYANDQELVAIYCAMTKWKSGDFFSAMDALQKYMMPAIAKVKALGVEVDSPDPAAIKAEGQKKVDAICSAANVDEAAKLAREFQSWGQTEARDKIGNELSQNLDGKIKAKGDALRDKVNKDVKEFADQEAAAMQNEINDLVSKLVETKKAQIQAAAKSAGASGVNSLIAAARSDIEAQVQSLVADRTAKMKQKIQAKVDEIVGPQKKQFEDIGQALNEAGGKIDEEIKANRSQYDKYKSEAFTLRKALVFKMLDKNMTEGLKKLDEANADIEAARKEDPTIKSVSEVKAALAQDRQVLEGKLNAALESGDDMAFEQVLVDFKTKWEAYRTDMEKVAKQAVGKACAMAVAQFAQGRAQIDNGVTQINALQNRCLSNTSDECVSVNEFADRFSTILGKFSDIKTEMGLAEKMCQAPETADKTNLIALLKKIQSDAQDLKTYGQALEAEKQKAIADSVQKACSQSLPQLKAAQAEIQNNDLTVLKSNLDKCRGKNTPECQGVNALTDKYNVLAAAVSEFSAGKAQIEKFCASSQKADDLQEMSALLGGLKEQSKSLRLKAKELQAEQAEKASAKAFCRAVTGQLGIIKSGLTDGLNQTNYNQKACTSKKDDKCQQVNSWGNKFDKIKQAIAATFSKISDIQAVCQKADTKPPSADLISKMESLKKDEADIKKMVADLKDEIDKIKVGQGIWLEAESASSYNTRTGVSNPMARENNPPWRPPYFGRGSWYMGAGGDYLNYDLAVPKAGKYNVWVRDYVDKFQPRGVRRIIVEFDGKRYGVFPETTVASPGDKGAFGWHKIGVGIDLSVAAHKMKITKESTSVGAAILDAFYFTTGDDTPPEK